MPLVSIVIPSFNRGALLAQAIESVLQQSVTDLEVIVVDDGSIDDTAEVVGGFQSDARLHYMSQAHRGCAIARNLGANAASGEFIGWLDSDDTYLPDALHAHLEVFADQPDSGMSIGGYDYVDEEGRLLGVRTPWTEGGSLDLRGWLFNCYAIPSSVLIRRAWYKQTAGFDPECEIAEDWALYLALAAKGCRMAWARRSVCQYRQHRGASVVDFAQHRVGAQQTLRKFFAAQKLAPEIIGLEKQAEAWANVLYAKKAYLAGEPDLAVADLDRAVESDPALAAADKPKLLEFLLTPTVGLPEGQRHVQELLLSHAPRRLAVSPRDLQRASARAANDPVFSEYHRRRRQPRLSTSESRRQTRPQLAGQPGRHCVLCEALAAPGSVNPPRP